MQLWLRKFGTLHNVTLFFLFAIVTNICILSKTACVFLKLQSFYYIYSTGYIESIILLSCQKSLYNDNWKFFMFYKTRELWALVSFQLKTCIQNLYTLRLLTILIIVHNHITIKPIKFILWWIYFKIHFISILFYY